MVTVAKVKNSFPPNNCFGEQADPNCSKTNKKEEEEEQRREELVSEVFGDSYKRQRVDR